MKISKTQLKRIIKEELKNVSNKKKDIVEGLENVTPENLQLALDALLQIVTQPEVAYTTLAAAVGISVERLRSALKSMAHRGKPEA